MTMKIHSDLLGFALSDFHRGKKGSKIYIHSPDFDIDEIDPAYYFRSQDKMPELEKMALSYCRGIILDAGSGAGSHSLFLQKEGAHVIALDISPGACRVMKERGVRYVVNTDIHNYEGEKPDTLLMLMNGIGLFANLNALDSFFGKLRFFLNPGGQFIFDSTDLIYIFEESIREDSEYYKNHYYGEIQFRMEYRDYFSPSFRWLYIDFHTLQRVCHKHDLKTELIFRGDNYNYLARVRI